MATATATTDVWNDSDYAAIAAGVDSLFRQMSQRDENTPLSYDGDELVLGEITALLRALDRYARGSNDVSVETRASARRFETRLFELENLIAYSQVVYVAAGIQPLMQAYADFVMARNSTRMATVDELDPALAAQVADARFFLKYIVDAAPSIQGYNLRLYGMYNIARLVDMIDEITQGRYSGNVRGVLKIQSARRIARHIEKLHAIYAERFQIGPTNIAKTPRTGVARVLFASWQDLNQMNGLFPNDAIIERALQNTPVGEEIVERYADFIDALERCAKDMRDVIGTAWIVAQQMAYMRLTQKQREYCAEIGNELHDLADDVRDIIHSHDGMIFYHGLLKKKYNQLLVDDLEIAKERYSCEFV